MKNKIQPNKTKFFVSIIALFLFLFFANEAVAGAAVLNWNANSEPDLAGYKIHYDTTSRSSNCPGGYANHADAGKATSYTVNNLAEGHVYYFQLTAYDTSGNESACSASPGEVNKILYYKGDFNKNRGVDIFDYNILVQYFGNSACGNQADSDGNCKVNIFDYNNLVSDFGKTF